MDITKFLEANTSLCMDDENDRATLADSFRRWIASGMWAIDQINRGNYEETISDNDIQTALIIVEFILKFGNQRSLPTLSRWASAEYCSLNRVLRDRNLEWPQGDIPAKKRMKNKST